MRCSAYSPTGASTSTLHCYQNSSANSHFSQVHWEPSAWCSILAAAGYRVSYPQAIWSIIFICAWHWSSTITRRFTITWYGMHYCSEFNFIFRYSQSGCRWQLSYIRPALGHTDCTTIEMQWEVVLEWLSRPWLRMFGDTLARHHSTAMKMHLEHEVQSSG